jgi:uncharacterized protein (DUF305 family)
MNTEKFLYGVIGLLGGVILTGAVAGYSVNNSNQTMMRMMGMQPGSMMTSGDGMTMDGMVGSLKGKTGDEFDKTFISGMIEHHQGAIEMAKLAKANAKHDEVKKMADDIIAAQSKEIDLMQSWQSDWGYKSVPTSHGMMSH